MTRTVDDVLDELRRGDGPLIFRLRNGREVLGYFDRRVEDAVRLERPSGQVPIDQIESILIEVTSEGPE